MLACLLILQVIWLGVQAGLSGCGDLEEQQGTSGMFSSKNYPNLYDKNLACRWSITVSKDKLIRLTFADVFHLDKSPGCLQDSIAIYDGSVNDEVIKNGICKNNNVKNEGRYCGRDIPLQYTSKSNKLIVEFCSDDFIEGRGFEIRWKELGDKTSANTCGDTIVLKKDTIGYIETLNYDGKTLYPTDHQCEWIIKAPEGMGVQLDSEAFDLEPSKTCLFDRLLVHEGPNIKAPVIRAFCDNSGPKAFVSSKNEIFLRFISDIANARTGFRIKYSATCPFTHFKCGKDCIPANKYCDGQKDCSNGMDEQFCSTENIKCGNPIIKPEVGYKIVGGTEVKAHSWPWQVPLLNDGYLMCGASIITPDWVLTASHCFEDFDGGHLSIRVGEHNLKKYVIEPNQKDYDVEKVFEHEEFDIHSFDNDIALLKLKKSIQFNDHVKPICLPKLKSSQPSNRLCYSTGWGGTKDDFMSDTLQQVALPIISQVVCNSRDYLHDQLTENMLCAGFPHGKQDTCQGDSGGPFTCQKDDDSWELYGITSWGAGCGLNKYPGIYARVSNYIDWIDKTISQN